jgi:hypothetical protein
VQHPPPLACIRPLIVIRIRHSIEHVLREHSVGASLKVPVFNQLLTTLPNKQAVVWTPSRLAGRRTVADGCVRAYDKQRRTLSRLARSARNGPQAARNRIILSTTVSGSAGLAEISRRMKSPPHGNDPNTSAQPPALALQHVRRSPPCPAPPAFVISCSHGPRT